MLDIKQGSVVRKVVALSTELMVIFLTAAEELKKRQELKNDFTSKVLNFNMGFIS